jgi:hypothetical protein
MTLKSIFNSFPHTRGIDKIKLYIIDNFGIISIRGLDVNQKESLWWNLCNSSNLSEKFLEEYSSVCNFEFLVENEDIVLEIQVKNVETY